MWEPNDENRYRQFRRCNALPRCIRGNQSEIHIRCFLLSAAFDSVQKVEFHWLFDARTLTCTQNACLDKLKWWFRGANSTIKCYLLFEFSRFVSYSTSHFCFTSPCLALNLEHFVYIAHTHSSQCVLKPYNSTKTELSVFAMMIFRWIFETSQVLF